MTKSQKYESYNNDIKSRNYVKNVNYNRSQNY